MRTLVEQKRLENAALNDELKQRMLRIFEAASENSEILMRHQNGCMIVEDRAPGDFANYVRLMNSNTVYAGALNAYMKLYFTDARTGHNWAFLLHQDTFAAIEAELSSVSA